MLRNSLEDVPAFVFPPGFCLRWYQPGDENHWLQIHRLADQENEITPAINLYLTFGFVPLIRSEEEAVGWRGICRQRAAETFSLPACSPGQPLR